MAEYDDEITPENESTDVLAGLPQADKDEINRLSGIDPQSGSSGTAETTDPSQSEAAPATADGGVGASVYAGEYDGGPQQGVSPTRNPPDCTSKEERANDKNDAAKTQAETTAAAQFKSYMAAGGTGAACATALTGAPPAVAACIGGLGLTAAAIRDDEKEQANLKVAQAAAAKANAKLQECRR